MSSKDESSTEDDISNWEMVSGHQADDDGTDSDSSIEVVSMDMDHEPVPLGAGSPKAWGPVFVLRVPSNEKDDLTTESEESDECDSNPTRGLRMVCHRETSDSPTEDSAKLSDSLTDDSAKLSDSPTEESAKLSDSPTEESAKLSDSPTDDSAKLSNSLTEDSSKLSDSPTEESAKLSDSPTEESAKLSDSPTDDSTKLSDSPTDDSAKLFDSSDVASNTPAEDSFKQVHTQCSSEAGPSDAAVHKDVSVKGDNLDDRRQDIVETVPTVSENVMPQPSQQEKDETILGAVASLATNDLCIRSNDETAIDCISEEENFIEEALCDSHIQRPISLEDYCRGDRKVESPVTGAYQEPQFLLTIPVKHNFVAVDQQIKILEFVKNQNPDELPMVVEADIEDDNENPLENVPGNQGNGDLPVNENEADEEDDVIVNEEQDIEEIQLEDEVDAAEQGPLLVQPEQPVLDAAQDDTETESSNEYEPEDDRIESDQSDLHTPDNSNLSNVDIADLMVDNHVVLRGYIHQPNSQLNLTLNYVVGIVLVIVVGMGIGHSIGSSFRSQEQISSEQQRMSVIWDLRQQIQACHNQVLPELENVKQQLHQCQSKSSPDLELENQQLMAAYQRLREKANFLQNEVTELREEVTKLKYKGLTAIIVQPSSAMSESVPYQDKKNHLLNKINSLEQERIDLMTAVAVSRYGKPPSLVDESLQLTQQGAGHQPKDIFKTNMEADKIDDSSSEAEDEKIAEEVKMVFERYGTTDRNLLIYKLSRDLDWMMSKVELWEKLYREEKKKSVSTCPPTGNVKLEDILYCFGKMTKDYVRFSNFTEVFEKHWKQWMHDSYSNVKKTMDVLSQFMASADSKQDSKSTENSGEKFQDSKKSSEKGDDKWSDAMRDLFNKTKASVSNVNEQIQETWKQVKNLSNDFWKKHQPSYCALKKEISEKITKMTHHFNKWVNKSRCERRHPHKKRWKEHKGKYASTKRREPENQQRHDRSQGFKTCKQYNRQGVKIIRRAMKKIGKLNVYRFKRMHHGDIQYVYSKFEEMGHVVHFDCLDRADGEWFKCQKLWWFNSLHGVYVPDQNCRAMLADWQVSINTERPSTHSKSNYWKRRKNEREHFKHSTKDKSDRDQFKHGSFKSQHGNHDNTACFEDFSLRLDDMQEEVNSTQEEWSGKQEETWYMKQMKARELERQREEKKKNSKWLFDRAEERDYQRTTPDDWYSQRMKNDGHQ